jgi:hypothetical protein
VGFRVKAAPVFQVQGALGQSSLAGDLRRLNQPAKGPGATGFGVAALVRIRSRVKIHCQEIGSLMLDH